LLLVSIMFTKILLDVLWRYFSWANQTTAALALWIATMYLLVKGQKYWISLIPSLFITDMVLVYILNAKRVFIFSLSVSNIGGMILTLIFTLWFFKKGRENKENKIQTDL